MLAELNLTEDNIKLPLQRVMQGLNEIDVISDNLKACKLGLIIRTPTLFPGVIPYTQWP